MSNSKRYFGKLKNEDAQQQVQIAIRIDETKAVQAKGMARLLGLAFSMVSMLLGLKALMIFFIFLISMDRNIHTISASEPKMAQKVFPEISLLLKRPKMEKQRTMKKIHLISVAARSLVFVLSSSSFMFLL